MSFNNSFRRKLFWVSAQVISAILVRYITLFQNCRNKFNHISMEKLIAPLREFLSTLYLTTNNKGHCVYSRLCFMFCKTMIIQNSNTLILYIHSQKHPTYYLLYYLFEQTIIMIQRLNCEMCVRKYLISYCCFVTIPLC